MWVRWKEWGATVKQLAIPTSYAGVRFRSRLEARWASFFDEVCWGWDYEPADFAGWTPDFLVDLPGLGPRFAEVKPAKTLRELSEMADKVCVNAIALGLGPMAGGRVLGLRRGDGAGAWHRVTTKTSLMEPWRAAYNMTRWPGRSRDPLLVNAVGFPWGTVVRRHREALGDEPEFAQQWSKLAAELGKESDLYAGLLNMAEQASFDGSVARAVYREKSIAGALLSSDTRQRMTDAADKLGVRLIVSRVPGEAFGGTHD